MLIKTLIRQYLSENDNYSILDEISDIDEVQIDDFTQCRWFYKEDDGIFYRHDGKVELLPNILIISSHEINEYTIFLIESIDDHMVVFESKKKDNNILGDVSND